MQIRELLVIITDDMKVKNGMWNFREEMLQ